MNRGIDFYPLCSKNVGSLNPLRYRGYVYDKETKLYYLQSRYYNPKWGRFISADNQLSTGDILGMNLFAYCGNNPVNRIDPTGEAWWHWAIGATVVVGFGVLTVAMCGWNLALAATSVGLVANGVAAASAATTIAAAAFIGSATVYGTAALAAASNSNSLQDFADQGSWGTVAATIGGGILSGYGGYKMSQALTSTTTNTTPTRSHTTGVGSPDNNVNPGGSYTKLDNNGNIYSYTQFDDMGRQTMRIDFQGKPHAGVLPHIHMYIYLP